MPKRACPFDDNLSPQLKVHVGQKQVDNGVFKEARMKKVYDKTLNLLKLGAKELAQNENDDSIDTKPAEIFAPKVLCTNKSKSQQNLKQMILNNKLQLETTGKDIKDIPLGLCGCCRMIDQNESTKCCYCDKILCSSCLANCSKCFETFCKNCSLIMYDGGEHSLCLNCYH
ncbi:apoptosis regulatory protein Siva [Cephus cinctus]|uniref:Apoptosis regulatory protein Siva n=1 Tax=Cephus cinctus TaxID=211228 RepID=A0AAJ7C4L2_CEPCN|nr:apoptosis regulatory protein Siva [Cephus cinctus]